MRTTTPGRPLPVSWRGRFVELLIRHVPPGLATAYRGRMPSTATVVQLYAQGDGGEEMRLELLGQPEPASGAQPSVNPGATTCRSWR